MDTRLQIAGTEAEILHRAREIPRKTSSLRAFGKVVGNAATLSASRQYDKPKWCFDSGATSHFCKQLQDFSEVQNAWNGRLNLANDESTEVKAKGTAVFSTNIAGKQNEIWLTGALHVPNLGSNLLSVSKTTENNYDVIKKSIWQLRK